MGNTQAVKTEIINNVMVAMSYYIQQQAVLAALEQVMQQELVRVNMEEITTLPAERQDEVAERNRYLIQLFMVKRRDLSKGTLTGYLSAVKRLMVEINGKSLDQMDEMDIDWYLSQYEQRNVSSGGHKNAATTVNNERRFLSAFYTWMRKAKLIADNPVECIPAKKVALKPIDYYTPEEMARMRDACRSPRQRAILEVFRSTGARVGELVGITMDQVDLETGDIWIQGEKGGRYRIIYLDDDARYYYKRYLTARKGDSTYLIPSAHKPYGKTSTCALRNLMKGIGKRAGLKCRVYPHKMRKTLGMNLKNHGVDIGTIQEVLGHASPAVTSMYYAQSTPHTLRGVRERVSV